MSNETEVTPAEVPALSDLLGAGKGRKQMKTSHPQEVLKSMRKTRSATGQALSGYGVGAHMPDGTTVCVLAKTKGALRLAIDALGCGPVNEDNVRSIVVFKADDASETPNVRVEGPSR